MTESQVTLATLCEPSENVVAREIEGDMIIVPLVAGMGDTDDELYTLNETGKAIWQELNGQQTLGQVAEKLADEFSCSEGEIEEDVLGFTSELVRRGMLAVKG